MKLGDMPAFPHEDVAEYFNGAGAPYKFEQHKGMTLRQYYAGLAMQELVQVTCSEVASAVLLSRETVEPEKMTKLYKACAESACQVADALLAELEK